MKRIPFIAIFVFVLLHSSVACAVEIRGCPNDEVVFISPKEGDVCPVCKGELQKVEEGRIGLVRGKPYLINNIQNPPPYMRGLKVVIYSDPISGKRDFKYKNGWERKIVDLRFVCDSKMFSHSYLTCPDGSEPKLVEDRKAVDAQIKEREKAKFLEQTTHGFTQEEAGQVFENYWKKKEASLEETSAN
ncbi:MAG: hypothetical protein AB1530_00565 [Candidatus Omnitrophota bacterium]